MQGKTEPETEIEKLQAQIQLERRRIAELVRDNISVENSLGAEMEKIRAYYNILSTDQHYTQQQIEEAATSTLTKDQRDYFGRNNINEGALEALLGEPVPTAPSPKRTLLNFWQDATKIDSGAEARFEKALREYLAALKTRGDALIEKSDEDARRTVEDCVLARGALYNSWEATYLRENNIRMSSQSIFDIK